MLTLYTLNMHILYNVLLTFPKENIMENLLNYRELLYLAIISFFS